MPTHFKKICSIIDDLSFDLDFEISEQSEPKKFEFSQKLKSHHFFNQSNHDAASILKKVDSQSNHIDSRDVTSDTSLFQRIEGEKFKKSKKMARPKELQQFQDDV